MRRSPWTEGERAAPTKVSTQTIHWRPQPETKTSTPAGEGISGGSGRIPEVQRSYLGVHRWFGFSSGIRGGEGSGNSATLLSSRATTTGAVLAPGSGRILTITWRGKERQSSIARSRRAGDFESARDVSYRKAIEQKHC